MEKCSEMNTSLPSGERRSSVTLVPGTWAVAGLHCGICLLGRKSLTSSNEAEATAPVGMLFEGMLQQNLLAGTECCWQRMK